ncbi:MAG: metal-dependent hydrolase [Patescibacteria group bacterium]|nr:metal-dependent hydrolase [Patescibacteria group bacterium]
MTGRTHDLAAFTSLVAVVCLNPPATISLSTLLLSLLANQIGGVLPDIDQPTAPFWRNLPIGNIFGRTFGKLAGGHRFITHSVLGLAITGFGFQALLTFLGPILGHADTGFIWWAFIIGLISHLLMDSFTKEGVPLLLPIPWHFGIPPLKALRITTGKKVEGLIVFPLLFIAATTLFISHHGRFITLLHSIR